MFKKKRLRSMISLLLSFTMSVGLLYISASALDDPADALAAKEAAVISEAEANGGLIAVGTQITEEEAALIEESLEQDRQAAEQNYRFTPFRHIRQATVLPIISIISSQAPKRHFMTTSRAPQKASITRISMFQRITMRL